MKISVKPSRVSGRVAVPGSKSHTIRGIIGGLMASGVSVLHAPLTSDDTISVLDAACALGASAEKSVDKWVIAGTGGKLTDPGKVLDLGNSGTGLRMLGAVAANAPFQIRFDGDDSLRSRLMQGELDALEKLGVKVSSNAGKAPLSVHGPIKGGNVMVDGTTSQFISALLFASAFAENDSCFMLPLLNEKPYVRLTLKWLDMLGVRLERGHDLQYFKMYGRQTYKPFEYTIPADFSTAAFPLVAAIIAGRGEGVQIANLDFDDVQGDKEVFRHLENMGAKYVSTADALTVLPGKLTGKEIDLNSTPDALPAMAVAAALAEGRTGLLNVPQARLKETDRIACMARELRKMGAKIEELPDGMVIYGGSLHGSMELESHHDHRVAMSLAVAALAAEGESVINNAECAAVTYPGFVGDMKRLGADITEK